MQGCRIAWDQGNHSPGELETLKPTLLHRGKTKGPPQLEEVPLLHFHAQLQQDSLFIQGRVFDNPIQ